LTIISATSSGFKAWIPFDAELPCYLISAVPAQKLARTCFEMEIAARSSDLTFTRRLRRPPLPQGED
jgi:hypothetical protein